MQVCNDRIPEVDAVRIRVLADNYYDALRPDSQAAGPGGAYALHRL